MKKISVIMTVSSNNDHFFMLETLQILSSSFFNLKKNPKVRCGGTVQAYNPGTQEAEEGRSL